MTAKQGCLIGSIVLAVLLVCGGLIAVPVYWLVASTSEVAAAADQYLSRLGNGQISEAYELNSSRARELRTLEEFKADVRRRGLTDYVSSSWTSRKIENDQATLEGTVTLKSGSTMPSTVQLVRESGEWRVLSVSTPEPTKEQATQGAGRNTIPPLEELRVLITSALLKLDEAIGSDDFSASYESTSALLKSRKSEDEWKANFQRLIDQKPDLSSVHEIEPEFSGPPALDDDGKLILKGYFPTRPELVRFHAEFVYEHPAWKLLSLQVELGR